MKTLADAKIGDTVTLTGIVRTSTLENKDLVFVDFPGCSYIKGLTPETHVDQIIPKPWEPKVGDKVRNKHGNDNVIYTIIAFHNGSAWFEWTNAYGTKSALVTFKKDNYTLCAD